MTYASDGYNAMSQNMHRFVREHICEGNLEEKGAPGALKQLGGSLF